MGRVPTQGSAVRELPDRVLVRRPVEDGWLAALPPSPPGARITVSVTEATAAIRHAAELSGHGYEPIGAAGEEHDGGHWADFMVPRELTWVDHAWVRQLCGTRGRLYEPAMGPVRLLLGPVLAAHVSLGREMLS